MVVFGRKPIKLYLEAWIPYAIFQVVDFDVQVERVLLAIDVPVVEEIEALIEIVLKSEVLVDGRQPVEQGLVVDVHLRPVGVDVITSNNMFAFSFLLESEKEVTAKTKLQLELNLLKYQINPHFLMNTLNNIHALIEDDQYKAQEAVRTLSKIMRYMYYDTSKEFVDLAKDVENLRSYFELMKLRFTDNINIQFNVPEELPHVKVAPNLFVNLAENAMKHGVSCENASFVHLSLKVNGPQVICDVRNSRFENRTAVESTGFGVENLKKRLDLIYPGRYEYKVEETKNEYFVELIIPVQ